MNNAELVAALRWCQKHGCSKCVALLDNGSCKYGGAIKILDAAADALEAAEKRIAELNTKCADLQSQINSMENEIEELLPKEGEWTHVEGDEPWEWRCTACHKIAEGLGEFRFCPNCGARMKGERE